MGYESDVLYAAERELKDATVAINEAGSPAETLAALKEGMKAHESFMMASIDALHRLRVLDPTAERDQAFKSEAAESAEWITDVAAAAAGIDPELASAAQGAMERLTAKAESLQKNFDRRASSRPVAGPMPAPGQQMGHR